MVELWNSRGGKVKVEQWGRKVEQCWLNSETEMVEPWNSDSGKVWWKRGTVWVEQCGGPVLVERWNSDAGIV